MAILDKSTRLKKELTLLDVYALSLGATLSSGFFLLPGMAFREAGPAVVLTYVIAVIPLLPGILCKIELSTAMPRAGGVYYFLDRSIGPAFGTIGGIGTWLTLVLKVAFALVGLGAYVHIFWPQAPMKALAVILAVLFGVLNLFGARKSGYFQVILVAGLLVLLVWFMFVGFPKVDTSHFSDFFGKGPKALLSTVGLVCIGYIGLSKVASVSEEVKDPERNLPRGMFLAIGTSLIIYAGGTWVMVGVLSPEALAGEGAMPNLTPVATAANALAGRAGMIVMTVAAILAFFSVANAGILGASRYPLAMSRDHLMPSTFRKLGRFGTPTNAIVLTVVMVVISVLIFDPLQVAKLAGAFQLLLFALNCLAVVIMREARIDSYDPGYRAPLYPWIQIVGMIFPFIVIAEMGWLPIVFCGGLFVVGSAWFLFYGRPRVRRRGAINYVFRRLSSEHFDDLDRELRSILKEKGLRAGDPFDKSVLSASVFDAGPSDGFEQIVAEASRRLAERMPISAEDLATGFLEGTRTGATPVTGGVALPHMRLPGIDSPMMVLVRCRGGLELEVGDVFGGSRRSGPTFALFFLASPTEDPGQHLRLLAELASSVETDEFLDDWLEAEDEVHLRECLLRNERFFSLMVDRDGAAGAMIDRPLREMKLPEGCLVAVIRRASGPIVPGGGTVVRSGDRLTIIGDEAAVTEVRAVYG